MTLACHGAFGEAEPFEPPSWVNELTSEVSWPDGKEATPLQDVAFTFSDGADVVLRVTSKGVQSRESYSAAIYGNGLVRLERREHWGGESPKIRLVETAEIYLAGWEVKELVEVAVRYGLVDADPADIMARSRGVAIDGGVLTVELILRTYARGNTTKSRIESSVTIASPTYLSALNPEVLELRGMNGLSNKLSEFRDRAEAVVP